MKECDISVWCEKMFSGEKINIIEDCVVFYIVFCNCVNIVIMVDGENVIDVVNVEFVKMKVFVSKVCSGEWLGYIGKIVKDVVVIGVGGLNLGL